MSEGESKLNQSSHISLLLVGYDDDSQTVIGSLLDPSKTQLNSKLTGLEVL